MESKNQGYRFQFLSKLRQDFSKEKDEKKLENILAFGRAAIELLQRINDEEYVLREAKGLRDQSIYLLIQWVWRDCRRLSSGYAELANETQRYAALDFFGRRVDTFKNEAEIRELVCFAKNAEKTSMDLNDSDYIPQRALSLGSNLSTQLLEIINGWEGVFRLTAIEGALADEVKNLRFILFSSGGELGIVGSLSHPDLLPMVFQKVSFQENPDYLTSRQSFASAVPSVLTLAFSENFKSIQGTLLEPGQLKRISFQGTREVGVFALSKNPCTEAQMLGRYRTRIKDVAGLFVIERIGPRQYASIFVADDSSLRIPFSFGRYNENTGRLTFLNMQKNVPLGWRLLADSTDNGKCEIKGWGLSTFTGENYPLAMKKSDDVVKTIKK